MKDRWKIIITGGIFALCAAAVAATVLYIFNGNAPKITFLLFIIVCVLCLGSLLVWIGYIVKAIKNKSKQKRLQNAGLLQIPAEDVTRKPIEYNDEKGFKELEEHTLKFFENIVYPQGFIEFLKRYTMGLDGDKLAKEDEKLKRFVQRGGQYYEAADVYPPDELIEINKNILLYSDDYHTQFRDILLFADDESGRCHFLLDYGKGGEPKVKYLDDETDVVITLADSFAEFTEKLTGEPENSD